jgi:hypothetical protein
MSALVVATSLLLVAAGGAGAKAPHLKLVASATMPGAALPTQVTFDLWGFLDDTGLRVLRHPAADRAVLADPGRVWTRRHGRWVPHTVPSCAHVEVQVGLHPGRPDALALARGLLPDATLELYSADSGSLAPLTTPRTVDLELERLPSRRPVGTVLGVVDVRDWQDGAFDGLWSVLVRSTIVKRTGRCRPGRFASSAFSEMADEITPGRR